MYVCGVQVNWNEEINTLQKVMNDWLNYVITKVTNFGLKFSEAACRQLFIKIMFTCLLLSLKFQLRRQHCRGKTMKCIKYRMCIFSVLRMVLKVFTNIVIYVLNCCSTQQFLGAKWRSWQTTNPPPCLTSLCLRAPGKKHTVPSRGRTTFSLPVALLSLVAP